VNFGTATGYVSSAPTLTLYNQLGSVVPGFGTINASGYTAGTVSTVQTWYNLAGTVPVGIYKAVFNFPIVASSLSRIYEPAVGIEIYAIDE
jgi:hypothetical protein